MPGHVKLGKAGEPDPDPCPYLVVTLEMKREFALKPYDPKKSYWCPDGKGGYMESMLEDDDGTKARVICGGFEVKHYFLLLSNMAENETENTFQCMTASNSRRFWVILDNSERL